MDCDDIYGDGVNIPARLEGFAAPGEICISEVVKTAVAEAHYFRLVYGFSESPEQDKEEALEAARLGVELDNDDATAHCTLGRVFMPGENMIWPFQSLNLL